MGARPMHRASVPETEMAVSSDVVRIVIRGRPQPYSERTGVGKRKIWSYRPDHVRTYQDHLRRAAEDAMGDRPLFTGPVCLTIRAFMPIPQAMLKADRVLAERELLPHTKRPDLDNLHKAAKDALKGRVWRDDAQACMYGQPFKVYSPQPRLEIEVRAVTTIADVVSPEEVEGTPAFTRFVQEALF